MLNEIDPSETSKILANNIIKSLVGQPPNFASKSFLEVNGRWLNGNVLCDRLGLGRPGIYYWALMAGQCLFFMAICYSYRAVPYLDKRKITVSGSSRGVDIYLTDTADVAESVLVRHYRKQERSWRGDYVRFQIHP